MLLSQYFVIIYMACFITSQKFNWNMSKFQFQFWYYNFCPICLIDLISNVSENRMHRKFKQIVKYVWWRGYLPGLSASIFLFFFKPRQKHAPGQKKPKFNAREPHNNNTYRGQRKSVQLWEMSNKIHQQQRTGLSQ